MTELPRSDEMTTYSYYIPTVTCPFSFCREQMETQGHLSLRRCRYHQHLLPLPLKFLFTLKMGFLLRLQNNRVYPTFFKSGRHFPPPTAFFVWNCSFLTVIFLNQGRMRKFHCLGEITSFRNNWYSQKRCTFSST